MAVSMRRSRCLAKICVGLFILLSIPPAVLSETESASYKYQPVIYIAGDSLGRTRGELVAGGEFYIALFSPDLNFECHRPDTCETGIEVLDSQSGEPIPLPAECTALEENGNDTAVFVSRRAIRVSELGIDEGEYVTVVYRPEGNEAISHDSLPVVPAASGLHTWIPVWAPVQVSGPSRGGSLTLAFSVMNLTGEEKEVEFNVQVENESDTSTTVLTSEPSPVTLYPYDPANLYVSVHCFGENSFDLVITASAHDPGTSESAKLRVPIYFISDHPLTFSLMFRNRMNPSPVDIRYRASGSGYAAQTEGKSSINLPLGRPDWLYVIPSPEMYDDLQAQCTLHTSDSEHGENELDFAIYMDEVATTGFSAQYDSYGFENYEDNVAHYVCEGESGTIVSDYKLAAASCHIETEVLHEGVCHGMSSSALLFYNRRVGREPAAVPPRPGPTFTWELDDELRELIREYHEDYYATSSLMWRASKAFGVSLSSFASDIYSKIKRSLHSGRPVLLELAFAAKQEPGLRGFHTVVAYELIRFGHASYILCYDPNYVLGDDLAAEALPYILYHDSSQPVLTYSRSETGAYGTLVNLSILEPRPVEGMAVEFHCPIEVELRDDFGRRVTTSGLQEIYGTRAVITESMKRFEFPSPIDLTMAVEATAAGTMDISTTLCATDGVCSQHQLIGVSLRQETQGSGVLSPEDGSFVLSLDTDGDGVTDGTLFSEPAGEIAQTPDPPLPDPPRLQEIIVAPNPVTDRRVAFLLPPFSGQDASLVILDAGGRVVGRFDLPQASDRWPANGFWDIQDAEGDRLTLGPYVVMLVVDGVVNARGKMVVQSRRD